MTSINTPDFAMLHPDGRLEYAQCGASESIVTAMKTYITNMSTQGMGRLRAFFTDDFSALPANPLADRVFSSVGYHHPTGWRGTVAVTMEEDHTGECPPLTAEVRASLDELSAH